jgi:hypothetical protein
VTATVSIDSMQYTVEEGCVVVSSEAAQRIVLLRPDDGWIYDLSKDGSIDFRPLITWCAALRPRSK